MTGVRWANDCRVEFLRKRSNTMANKLATRKAGPLSSLWRSDPFTALREEVNDLRSRLMGEDGDEWFSGAMVPAMDLSETETAVEIRMDLPGITAKDIDIEISGNLLSIRGQREEEKEEKGKSFHRVERRSGSFQRTVTLPCPVVESEVAAECHDGVLTVTLPKTEESKKTKVKVKGAN